MVVFGRMGFDRDGPRPCKRHIPGAAAPRSTLKLLSRFQDSKLEIERLEHRLPHLLVGELEPFGCPLSRLDLVLGDPQEVLMLCRGQLHRYLPQIGACMIRGGGWALMERVWVRLDALGGLSSLYEFDLFGLDEERDC